ncbi:MAG: hypothetical protein LBK73_06705 [Treponema sp.]|nr:hypothetical protein [Treponema sp.]
MFKKALEYAGVYRKTTYAAIVVMFAGLAASVDADKILVIADGTVAQQGAHDELMAQAGIYRDFVTARESNQGWSRRKATG